MEKKIENSNTYMLPTNMGFHNRIKVKNWHACVWISEIASSITWAK